MARGKERGTKPAVNESREIGRVDFSPTRSENLKVKL